MSVDPSKLDVTLMVDANEKYTPIGNVVIPVENTSEQVMFRAKPPSSQSNDTVTFDIDTDGNFLGRALQILWDNIPLKCTLAAATGVTYTELDFHSKFFGGYKDLVMSPFGMLAGISSINVNIDGKNFQTHDVSTIMESICHYYSPDELARYFDASNHNIYYSNLVDETNPWIPSVTTDNQKVLIKASTLSQNDPFSATVDDRFNSRVPVFTCPAGSATANKEIKLKLHGLSTWLPFNLLGISGESSPLYHANNVKLTVTFHSNWVNRIFQTRRKELATETSSVEPMYKFALDTDATNKALGELRCCFKTFAAPQYVKSTMNASQDRYLQSYSLIEHDTKVTPIKFPSKDTSVVINSSDFNLRAIPKSLIISVANTRTRDEDFLTDPAHFARIDSLTVELAGKVTEIATGNGADQLFTLAKSNGLELNKTQALYTFGFPVRLNTSDNLTCPSNTYVGYSAFGDKGSITLRIRGSCTRLHHHTENGKFKVPTTDAPEIKDTEVFKRYAKEYELRVTVIYASYFAYRMTGSKFDVIESLSASTLDSLKSHTNMLKVSYAPRMNTLGGSWITSLLPTLKDIGKGAYNVVRDMISNKNGIRDKIVDSYKGATGGAFDNHMPLSGGAFPMQSNITAGRSIDGWDTF